MSLDLLIFGSGGAILIIALISRFIGTNNNPRDPSGQDADDPLEKVLKTSAQILLPPEIIAEDDAPELDPTPVASVQQPTMPREAAFAILKQFESAINQGNANILHTLIAPENRILQSKLDSLLKNGKIKYSLQTGLSRFFISMPNVDTVIIRPMHSARGSGWSLNGIPVTFKIQRRHGKWMIIESNVADRLGKKYIFSMIKVIVILIMFVIGLVYSYFIKTGSS